MNQSTTAEQGAFVLRVALGIMFIAHSVILKLMVFSLPGTAQYFESIGLPGALAYLVFAAETAGGVALVLGVWTRWVALALIPVIVGATWVHLGNGWVFSNPGGGWEYPVFLGVSLVVQALIGDGAYALRRSPAIGRVFGQPAPA